MILPAKDLTADRACRGAIIVGSGPVGIALARALAARGMACCVLEAGSMLPGADLADELATDDTAFALCGAIDGRTRQIGGGVNLWGGQLALPHASETGPTGEAPAGWPIDLAEITGRAGAATALLGQALDLDVTAGTNLGTARASLERSGLDLVTTAWLRTPKLPKSLWNELETSALITLAHGAFVEGIDVDADGAATGVQLRRPDGGMARLAGSPVILACGTIEIVRLLQQPLAQGRAPWAGLDWLGRGFTEHLEAAVATVTARDKRLILDVFDPAVVAGTRYSCKTFMQAPSGNAPEDRPLSAVGMLTLPGQIRNSIAELRMLIAGLTPRSSKGSLGDFARAIGGAAHETLPLAWRYLRHKRLATTLRGASTLRVSLEQPMRRDSRITLSDSLDHRGVRRARINWIKGDEEGHAFLAKARQFAQWAQASGAAAVEIDPLLLSDPTAFAAAADDGLHHAGGARMAISARDGVVDTDLAVFGARNLYCCGAATFPRLGYANPTLTAVALADRLADHLAGQKR